MKKTGGKMGRKKKILFFAGFFLLVLILGLWLWTESTERDYAGEEVYCFPNSIISREERIKDEFLYKYAERLQNLENGDILLTPCSHTLGWRNGHAAIVIDEEKELTLESVVLGTPTCVQSFSKWRKYPGVMVLRLKDATKEERNAIAAYTMENMQGVTYGFIGDFSDGLPWAFSEKKTDTHCAHLIWSVYQHFGYDIDGDGGIFVTPKDISLSPHLEIIEVHDVDKW